MTGIADRHQAASARYLADLFYTYWSLNSAQVYFVMIWLPPSTKSDSTARLLLQLRLGSWEYPHQWVSPQLIVTKPHRASRWSTWELGVTSSQDRWGYF